MPADHPIRRHDDSDDALLRAVGRATSAATSVLDPDLVPGNAVDAVVRHLQGLRADLWTFDGRHPVHRAHSGRGGDAPGTIPDSLVRIARGGLPTSARMQDLGSGSGEAWRRLVFALDAERFDVFPLMVGDQTIGALTVVPQSGSSRHVFEATATFARHVASALQQAGAHRAAQDAALSLRLQNRILAELTDSRDVPSLRTALDELATERFESVAVALLPVDSIGRLTVLDADTTVRVASEPVRDLVAPLLVDQGPLGLPPAGQHRRDELGLHEHDAPLWGVGLWSAGKPAGVLLLAADTASDHDVFEFLRVLAPAATIALENAQLFARQHVRATRLSAMNELARVVAAATGKRDLCRAIAFGVESLFGYDRVATYDTELRLLGDAGNKAGRGVDRERALVSTALHRRRASRIERPDRTCHAVPIATGDLVHAVLYVDQPETITPEQEHDDLRLLVAICEHAAACVVAIGATERIERNYKDTIQALVHALEARDQYTAGHSGFVAEWALEVGARLGMDVADLRDLELGAILHDIGKVAVPDQILNKPGRLTEDEFEVMKTHTVVGERILQPLGFLATVAPIVRYEHERWDGRGYPDGIAGEQIPLASRIIFVCDAYHAMTSDRPYRPAQTHGFARRVLNENAGTQFDPAVVSVFLDVIDAWCTSNGIDVSGSETGVEIVNPLRPQAQGASDAGDAAAA